MSRSADAAAIISSSSAAESRSIDSATLSAIRAAALPVGAASATRAVGEATNSSATRAATVRVFPLPGGPVSTPSRARPQTSTACCWFWER